MEFLLSSFQAIQKVSIVERVFGVCGGKWGIPKSDRFLVYFFVNMWQCAKSMNG